ncbi:MAG: MoaD/ThiS family protein, partial [Candidatus Baldrarchaeia archaeon]
TLKDLLDGLDEFIDLDDIFFVTVNGMIIDRADYSRVKLMNGDTIAIVPIVMGG